MNYSDSFVVKNDRIALHTGELSNSVPINDIIGTNDSLNLAYSMYKLAHKQILEALRKKINEIEK